MKEGGQEKINTPENSDDVSVWDHAKVEAKLMGMRADGTFWSPQQMRFSPDYQKLLERKKELEDRGEWPKE